MIQSYERLFHRMHTNESRQCASRFFPLIFFLFLFVQTIFNIFFTTNVSFIDGNLLISDIKLSSALLCFFFVLLNAKAGTKGKCATRVEKHNRITFWEEIDEPCILQMVLMVLGKTFSGLFFFFLFSSKQFIDGFRFYENKSY